MNGIERRDRPGPQLPEGPTSPWRAPALSVIVPTYEERSNVRAFVAAVADTLGDLPWEVIVVDDDSPDGTWAEVAAIAREEPRVRCLRRIGRRGLSSAVVEGVMVANADVVAVIDGDFQHDEALLRPMYDKLHATGADLVVGTRYADGAGLGAWSGRRASMSGLATRISRVLVGDRLSDPVSGFFVARRAVFTAAVHRLSQQGYNILIDLVMSAPEPLRIEETPYVFRARRAGASKVGPMVLAEFAFLLVDKLTRGLVPPRFVLFAIVGGLGLVVHLGLLWAAGALGLAFLPAQGCALLGAMAFNYLLNNEFTYRDRRLRGRRFLLGLPVFMLVCGVGAVANVGVAELAIERTGSWSLSGIAGAVMGAVFNFGAAGSLVWGGRRRG